MSNLSDEIAPLAEEGIVLPSKKKKKSPPSYRARIAEAIGTTDDQDLITLGVLIFVNVANVLLVVGKGWAAKDAGSFSIATSALESTGDVFVGFLTLATRLVTLFSSADRYPRGRHPDCLCNVIAATVMLTLGGVNMLLNLEKYVQGDFHPEFHSVHYGVVGGNLGLKALLLVLCVWRRKDKQMRLLMKDQAQDCVVNLMTLIFALVTPFNMHFDVAGALLTMFVIIYTWIPTARSNAVKLHGIEAKPHHIAEVQKVSNRNNKVLQASVCGYHRGEKENFEVDAVFHPDHDHRLAREELENEIMALDFVAAVYIRDVSSSAKPKSEAAATASSGVPIVPAAPASESNFVPNTRVVYNLKKANKE